MLPKRKQKNLGVGEPRFFPRRAVRQSVQVRFEIAQFYGRLSQNFLFSCRFLYGTVYNRCLEAVGTPTLDVYDSRHGKGGRRTMGPTLARRAAGRHGSLRASRRCLQIVPPIDPSFAAHRDNHRDRQPPPVSRPRASSRRLSPPLSQRRRWTRRTSARRSRRQLPQTLTALVDSSTILCAARQAVAVGADRALAAETTAAQAGSRTKGRVMIMAHPV